MQESNEIHLAFGERAGFEGLAKDSKQVYKAHLTFLPAREVFTLPHFLAGAQWRMWE